MANAAHGFSERSTASLDFRLGFPPSRPQGRREQCLIPQARKAVVALVGAASGTLSEATHGWERTVVAHLDGSLEYFDHAVTLLGIAGVDELLEIERYGQRLGCISPHVGRA